MRQSGHKSSPHRQGKSRLVARLTANGISGIRSKCLSCCMAHMCSCIPSCLSLPRTLSYLLSFDPVQSNASFLTSSNDSIRWASDRNAACHREFPRLGCIKGGLAPFPQTYAIISGDRVSERKGADCSHHLTLILILRPQGCAHSTMK